VGLPFEHLPKGGGGCLVTPLLHIDQTANEQRPSGIRRTLSIGTPSMTISGSLLALMEVPPRRRMFNPAPGSPLFEMIVRPATWPCNSWSGEV